MIKKHYKVTFTPTVNSKSFVSHAEQKKNTKLVLIQIKSYST